MGNEEKPNDIGRTLRATRSETVALLEIAASRAGCRDSVGRFAGGHVAEGDQEGGRSRWQNEAAVVVVARRWRARRLHLGERWDEDEQVGWLESGRGAREGCADPLHPLGWSIVGCEVTTGHQ